MRIFRDIQITAAIISIAKAVTSVLCIVPFHASAATFLSLNTGFTTYYSESVDFMNKRLSNSLRINQPYEFGGAQTFGVDALYMTKKRPLLLGISAKYFAEKHSGLGRFGQPVSVNSSTTYTDILGTVGYKLLPRKSGAAPGNSVKFAQRFTLEVLFDFGLMLLSHKYDYSDPADQTTVQYDANATHLKTGPRARVRIFIIKRFEFVIESAYQYSLSLNADKKVRNYIVGGQDLTFKSDDLKIDQITSTPFHFIHTTVGFQVFF